MIRIFANSSRKRASFSEGSTIAAIIARMARDEGLDSRCETFHRIVSPRFVILPSVETNRSSRSSPLSRTTHKSRPRQKIICLGLDFFSLYVQIATKSILRWIGHAVGKTRNLPNNFNPVARKDEDSLNQHVYQLLRQHLRIQRRPRCFY